MENLKCPASKPAGHHRQRLRLQSNFLMKDKSKAVLWLCFTLLVAAGIKYLPTYFIQQRQLDLQERILDIREDAFLHQKATPTVSDPEATHANFSQLL
jgi:hypothetical protein